MTDNRARQLAEIIVRVKLKVASREERALLGAWLDESEENRQLLKSILRGESIARRLRVEAEVDGTVDYRLVCGEVYRKLTSYRNHRRRWLAWSGAGAAAVVLLMLLVPRQEEAGVSRPEPPSLVLTERGKVTLTMGDGSVNLDKGLLPVLQHASFVVMDTAAGVLRYRVEEDTLPSIAWERHTVTTEVGGDFSFILSDGTRVWLNATSTFTYPIVFTGEERVVELEGEAYFEVMPYAGMPFIVRTAGVQVEVLGTSFNVSAYRDEENIYTTLLAGKVEVSLDGQQAYTPVVLTENMQSCWNRERGEFTVKRVVAEEFVSWRHGIFVFNEGDVEVVTRMLSRWYGVTFVYDRDRASRHTFGGKMKKDEKLEVILKSLTMAGGPEFRQEGNSIRVIERE
jgi:ferric-dicitrate binding protein FerR (iron transport regulator)